MRETKRKSVWREEPGNMGNPIIQITSIEDEEERAKTKKRSESESEEVVTVRSIKEEYKMISDLTGFDNLRAMIEAEAFMRRKKRKRKKKKKIHVEFQGQEEVTADAVEVKESRDESVETVEALTTQSVQLPENDLARKLVVNGANKGKLADTCNGVETMITLETESAEMKDNIVLRQLLRKSRYFDPPDDSWRTCSNCGKEDHATANCTMQKRKKLCSFCGSFEHIWKRCKQGQNCFVWKERGHLAIDCPENHQENNLNFNFCLRCGDSGHDMFSCRSDYSTDDLKEIQCYVCKSFGHLCCVDLPDLGPRQDICYKCGQSDHLGSVCTKSFGVIRYSKSPALCYKCRQEGHFARTCTNKRAGDFSTSARKPPNKMRNPMEPNSV